MTASAAPIPVERLIDFAAAHPRRFDGRVDEAIRTELGVTPARYFQLLSRAIRTERALEHDPVTTYRLRRISDQQARTRAARLRII